VHEVSGAPRTVGIDASDRYVAEARRRQPALEFVVADIAQALPIRGADLIASRFLLTHLARPADALTAWAEGAAPGARLALHETEGLTSSHAALIRYYELVGALQAHHGQALYIGAMLDGTLATTPWRVVDSRALTLEKPAAAMAELHVANLRTWRNDPFARDHFDRASSTSWTQPWMRWPPAATPRRRSRTSPDRSSRRSTERPAWPARGSARGRCAGRGRAIAEDPAGERAAAIFALASNHLVR
jgi:hypothetical protein